VKRFPLGIVTLLVLASALASCAHMAGSDWVTLIDGQAGLDNWNQIGDANWRAEGGAIVADKGKGGFLVSKNTYQDFEIRAEFWAESDTNSGVFLRCADASKVSAAICYEVNIWDIRPEPKYATGAIVDHAAVPVPIIYKAGGRWNIYEISAKGSQLTVKLNGAVTASTQDSKHASGPFALQYGSGVQGAQGGVIKWRKVQIRPL
jgi:3-keto-disaccharide hydrolase